MSHIFGGYKHFDSLKNTFFMGFIAQYFFTFFIEHPVYYDNVVMFLVPTYLQVIMTYKELNYETATYVPFVLT